MPAAEDKFFQKCRRHACHHSCYFEISSTAAAMISATRASRQPIHIGSELFPTR